MFGELAVMEKAHRAGYFPTYQGTKVCICSFSIPMGMEAWKVEAEKPFFAWLKDIHSPTYHTELIWRYVY
jgi:hypothetical protein